MPAQRFPSNGKIVEHRHAGFHRITEADVDRQIDPGAADRGGYPQPQPTTFELFADAINVKSVDVKFHTIIIVERQDVRASPQVQGRQTQQIEVTRAAMWNLKPTHHQHRAFQNEAVRMRRLAESSRAGVLPPLAAQSF